MRRHPELIPISRQHHQMLLLAQLLKKNAPPYPGLPQDTVGKMQYARQKYRDLVQAHFKKEEEQLFPFLRDYSPEIEQYCQDLLQDHAELRTLFEKIEQHQADESDLHQLGQKLDDHIRKEEREFFQLIQNTLNESAWEELGNQLT